MKLALTHSAHLLRPHPTSLGLEICDESLYDMSQDKTCAK